MSNLALVAIGGVIVLVLIAVIMYAKNKLKDFEEGQPRD